MEEKFTNPFVNMHRMDSFNHDQNLNFTNSNNSNSCTKMKLPPLSDIKYSEKCHCCPYGYHIDLDFVRYCEAMANGTYLRQLKQLKRNRRRQRKSIEALLNSHEDVCCHLNYSPQEKQVQNDLKTTGPPPDLVNTGDALRDALKEAMMDFEETYQKSGSIRTDADRKNSSNLTSIDLLNSTPTCQVPDREHNAKVARPNNLPFLGSDIFPLSLTGSRSRSGSASSLISSISTVSSYADNGPISMPTLPSQQMADTMATFASSFLSPPSSVTPTGGTRIHSTSSLPMVSMNKAALQSIREQMATSLQRMRELEEHVKSIPILQVKLSVLKEEKRLLLLQLKAKSSKFEQRSVGVGNNHTMDMSVDEMGQRLDQLGAMGITSPRPRRKMLPDHRTRSRSESPIFRNRSKLIDLNDFRSYKRAHPTVASTSPEDEICSLLEQVPKTDLYLRETRSVGTNCSVLTRDVGVSHIVTPSKSVAVGSNLDLSTSGTCMLCLERDKAEDPETLTCPTCEDWASRKLCKQLSRSDCRTESISPHPCFACAERASRIMFDASVVTDDYAARVSTVTLGTNTDRSRTYDSFTNTDLYMEDIISREEYDSVISSSASTSLRLEPEVRDASTQMIPIAIDRKLQASLSDFGLEAVPKQPKILTQSVGISTQSLNLLSKGVGDHSINDTICDRCRTVNKRTVGIGNFTIDDISLCDKCSDTHTRSVGCGDCKITDSTCLKCAKVRSRTIACGNASILDDYCSRCDNLRTFSVGVGNSDVHRSTCDKCLQRAVKNVGVATSPMVTRSIETNTNNVEKLKVDIPNAVNGKLNVCDKCNSVIHSLATDFVQKGSPNASSAPPPLPSRIPRLSIPESYVSGSQIVTTSATISTSQRITKIDGSKSQTRVRTRELEKDKQEQKLNASGRSPTLSKRFSSNSGKKKVHSELSSGQPELSSDESSDSSDSECSDSPDEGSYDGVYGKIVNICHDDEAIRQGLPGASMFQPIPETTRVKYTFPDDVLKAAKTLNSHLTNQSQVLTKELNSSLNLIQQEWFKISSQKGADAHIVEDHMDVFEDMSHALLDKVVNLADGNGNTAMHYAVSHGNFDVISLLLDSKVCDVNKQNKAGYTCIMLASLAQLREGSDRSVLQRLFKLGDINVKAAQHGQTALMLAVSHGRLDIVKMLLEAGADVNIQDEDGSTALMCAGEHGHVDIVRVLLSHPDCDPTLKDNDNSTALTIAMEAGHKDIGVLIYAHTSISRGSSPLSSFRAKKRTASASSTPPSRTPPPPSPASSRKSGKSVPFSTDSA